MADGDYSLNELRRDIEGLGRDLRELRGDLKPILNENLVKRVVDLEDNWKWLFRTIVFGIIIGALGVLFFLARIGAVGAG